MVSSSLLPLLFIPLRNVDATALWHAHVNVRCIIEDVEGCGDAGGCCREWILTLGLGDAESWVMEQCKLLGTSASCRGSWRKRRFENLGHFFESVLQ